MQLWLQYLEEIYGTKHLTVGAGGIDIELVFDTGGVILVSASGSVAAGVRDVSWSTDSYGFNQLSGLPFDVYVVPRKYGK